MKVIHICIGDIFSENMMYQENYYINAQIEEGNEVLVIADTATHSGEKTIHVEPGTKHYGKLTVIRLKLDKVINKLVTEKVRKTKELFNIIIDFKPDVIFYQILTIHGIKDLKKIKKSLPNVKIYADESTSFENSGTNFLSLNILHRIIYRSWIKKSYPYFEKIFYVSPEAKAFMVQIYNAPEKLLHYNPLRCKIIDPNLKKLYREEIYKKYGFTDDIILFSHTGKIDKLKKATDLMKIFSSKLNDNFRLIIAGDFSQDVEQEALELISNDPRILFIGFLNSTELIKLLCATNLYLQPGSSSHTAQTAIGCSTPVVTQNRPTYEVLVDNNGFLVNEVEELSAIFDMISINPNILKSMEKASYQIALKYLDYKQLSLENILK